MSDESLTDWRRTFNRFVGIAAAVTGVLIVLSSFLFVTDPFMWYLTVAVGLVVAVLGFAYGMFPFLTSQRRYYALRHEVEAFIDLVRDLNKAATAHGKGEDFDRVKAAMHEAVERMADAAGREGKL
jgi:hypothetical protein